MQIKKLLQNHWTIIIAFAVIKLIVHFTTNTNYELQRDALLYYSLGEHLAWGFASVPPFIGLMAKISTLIFGNTVFGMRFFPAIIGAASIIIISLIVKELKGGNWALVIACLAFLFSPAFLRSNTLFQPVSFNQFFWLLSAYFIVRLINSQNLNYWFLIFVGFGIAFLNKYSIAIFIVAFFVSLMLTEHRKLIWTKQFLIGGFIGFIIILPNLIWQHVHNWPLLHHMAELQQTQLVNISLTDFIIGQFIMNLPGIIVWITGLVVFLFIRAEKKYRVLALLYLFISLLLILMRGKSYYTLGIYTLLFAMGGYAIEKYYNKIFQVIVAVIIPIIALPMIPLSIPVMSHDEIAEYTKATAAFTNRWEDGEVYEIPQDYADMTGWKELNDIVITFWNSLSEKEQKECQIFAGNYGQAGAILFYGKKHNLPEPICFNDSFLFWAPDSIENCDLIYIEHEPGNIPELFQNFQSIGQVNDPYFRENGLKVYYCTGPVDTLKVFYAKTIRELKEKIRQ